MTDYDWKWTAIQAAPIPKGVLVVLKMADSKDNITYALGYHDGSNLVITAREDVSANLPVYWMALP